MIKNITIVLSLLFAFPVSIFALPCLPDFYFGADAEVREMGFVRDYGGTVYKQTYPQHNVYVGLKVSDYLGVEFGYESSRYRKNSAFLPIGVPRLGMSDTGITWRMNSRLKIYGWHTSLVGFFPLSQDNKWKLLAAFGLNNLKINIDNAVVEADNIPMHLGASMGQTKNILRLMTGIQYNLADWIGLRGTIRYENTSQFNSIEPKRIDSPATAKAKNSFIYGLGFFIST